MIFRNIFRLVNPKLLAVSALIFSSLTIKAQTFETFLRDSMDIYVKREMARWKIPGLSVAIVKEGKVLLEKGYGVIENGKPEKVNENSLFMIGSNSKAFTGTTMAMLAFQGKCSLNDRVQKWIPELKMKDPWVASHLTLTDILCHRMGYETFQGDFTWWGSDMNFQQCMEKWGKFTPMYNFRTTWGYTNMGFVIAGNAIEKISGKSWEDNITENIFAPLDMKNSIAIYAPSKHVVENMATPHTLVEGKVITREVDPLTVLAPAASIFSSAHDMSHWAIAQLDSGRFNGKQVIPMEAIEMTRTPQSIEGRRVDPKYETHYTLYGLGWELADYMGREVVAHTGGVDGFLSSVTLVPEEKLGIIVLTNTDNNSLFYHLKTQLLEAYFKLPYENRSLKRYLREEQGNAFMDMQMAAWRDTINSKPSQPVPLKSFAGKYVNEVYGEINAIEKEGNLELSFEHHPNLKAKLESLGKGRFLCTYSDPLFGIKVFPFVIKGKKVVSFTLSVADFLEFTTYEFVKK